MAFLFMLQLIINHIKSKASASLVNVQCANRLYHSFIDLYGILFRIEINASVSAVNSVIADAVWNPCDCIIKWITIDCVENDGVLSIGLPIAVNFKSDIGVNWCGFAKSKKQ